MAPEDTVCIVTARDEGDRLGATLAALAAAFPGARLVVADDGSRDATPTVAGRAGAVLVRGDEPVGKGGAATRAAQHELARALVPHPPVFVLCDGDLGDSAAHLATLADEVRADRADLAVAAFARRTGGGLGLARAGARAAIRSLTGLELDAPLSGQRALHGRVLPVVVPFAPRFGMEVGMTIDAARAGFRVREVELPLTHRATGRTPRGFAHRGRQLADVALAWLARK
jgi:glycosyltransferase involved in cell wall biosynthesis